ncbi:MAG: hypothetical protein V3W41_02015 [Planctomycetota bacterium]
MPFAVRTICNLSLILALAACASPPAAIELTDPAQSLVVKDPMPLGEVNDIRLESQDVGNLRVSINVRRQAFGDISYDWLRLRFENLSGEELIIAPEIEAIDADNTVVPIVTRDVATRTLGAYGRDGDRGTDQVVNGSTRAASTAAAFSGFGIGALALGLLGPAASATMGSASSGEAFANWVSTHWLLPEYALPAEGSALGLVALPGPRPLPLRITVRADDRTYIFKTLATLPTPRTR